MRIAEFQIQVGFTEKCWLWLGKKTRGGYGMYNSSLAHRISYRLLRGDIGNNMTLDHLCRNPECINPNHLEQVTLRENILRGKKLANPRVATHCLQGHLRNSANTYTRNVRGRIVRTCRPCNTLSVKRYKSRNLK